MSPILIQEVYMNLLLLHDQGAEFKIVIVYLELLGRLKRLENIDMDLVVIVLNFVHVQLFHSQVVMNLVKILFFMV